MSKTHVCPSCGGHGKIIAAHALMSDGSSQFRKVLPCFKCDGTGEISDQHWRRYERGRRCARNDSRVVLGYGKRRSVAACYRVIFATWKMGKLSRGQFRMGDRANEQRNSN